MCDEKKFHGYRTDEDGEWDDARREPARSSADGDAAADDAVAAEAAEAAAAAVASWNDCADDNNRERAVGSGSGAFHQRGTQLKF